MGGLLSLACNKTLPINAPCLNWKPRKTNFQKWNCKSKHGHIQGGGEKTKNDVMTCKRLLEINRHETKRLPANAQDGWVVIPPNTLGGTTTFLFPVHLRPLSLSLA